jgi:hypothetical protein
LKGHLGQTARDAVAVDTEQFPLPAKVLPPLRRRQIRQDLASPSLESADPLPEKADISLL